MLFILKNKKAITSFCAVFLGISCFAQPLSTNNNQNIIAGIEVGSKGVKLSILEKSATETGAFKILKDSSINTDFISFTMQSHDATLDALTYLYMYVKTQWKIPSANIATVISSGVKAQADKANKMKFIDALIEGEKIEFKEWEKSTPYFNGCLPIEVMAERGRDTLRFGPMKPVGLTNPHTMERCFAVVQLRQDNKIGTLFNIVTN